VRSFLKILIIFNPEPKNPYMKQGCFHVLTILLFSFAGFAQSSSFPSDSLKDIAIFTAIRSGETAPLEKLLDQGITVNDSTDRYSLLMMATLSGTISQMKLLVARGANVNYMNRDSVTALWIAIPDHEKTYFLLDQGADIHAVGIGGRTMLTKLALMPGCADLIRLFIQKGMDPKTHNPGNILIKNALISADTSNLAIFLNAGLDPNAPDELGNAPILDASLSNCYPTLKMLIEHGGDINATDKKYQFTPLMNATCAGDGESTELLIAKGANMRLLDFTNYNALMWLATSDLDRPDLVESLCRGLGDQLYKKATDNTDALSWFQRRGNNSSVQIILKYKQAQ
jgi:ankyrin repeat protein